MGCDVLLVGEPDTVGTFLSEEDGGLRTCSSPDEALAQLRALAGSVDGLPSLPTIYGDLTAAVDSPNCGAEQIAEVVCQDPALAAKILQLAGGLPTRLAVSCAVDVSMRPG